LYQSKAIPKSVYESLNHLKTMKCVKYIVRNYLEWKVWIRKYSRSNFKICCLY